MPRWLPPNQKMILQSIADDERRPMNEREAARRELATVDQPKPQLPSRRRHGRHAGVPPSQSDLDSDVENWYQRDLRDSGLTSSDRHDIFQGFDPSTQKLLDVFTNRLLGLFSVTDSQVLIDAYGKTKSTFVKAKVIETIRHIATYSIDKAEAQQFLNQLDQEK
jgi:hypothetical protein